MGVTRLDEEPVPKTGRGREAFGCSSRPAPVMYMTCRDGPEVKMPALISESGVRLPVAVHRCQVVER